MIDEQRYRELIQQLATGGITGNKTYHQYRDQYIPRDSESMDYAHGGGVGSMMKAKRGLVNEPGGYAGYEGNYYGGGADYMRPLGYVEDETIDVEDLTLPKRIGNFKISAAKPLNDQSGTIAAAPNIMENAGVQSIEGSLINDDFRNDKIRSMVPPNGRFSEFDKARMGAPVNTSLGYRDKIRDMVPAGYENMNALEKDIANVAYNTSQEEFDGDFNSDFYNDTTKNMRLEGEPWLAENWNVGDIFNKDTTLTGYQKFPKGDIWNNKDKYLAEQNKVKKGIMDSTLMGKIMGSFKRPEQMNEAYQAITESADDQGYGTYKGNQYKIQDNKIYSELFPHGKNFDSMFGSKSIEEMENEGYGSIGWAQDRLQKGKKISKRLHNILRKRGINKQGNWINRPTYEGAQFKDTIPTGPIDKGTSGGYQGPAAVSFNPQQFARAGRRADRPGGFSDPGKGSYGPWKADGGIINLIKR